MPKNKLNTFPFSTIHAQILASSNVTQAASHLGVSDHTLSSYLGKFLHQSQPMTFELLKGIPAETFRETYANYDSPWKSPSIKLENYPFSLIHARILETENAHQAASRLGVKDPTLSCYLGKFLHQGQPMTFELLKRISAESLRATYANYDSPWKPLPIKLENYPFSLIHARILQSENYGQAASHLGVSTQTLSCYLGKFLHQGQPMTIELLKEIPAETLRQTYANYDSPWKPLPIKLENYPFSVIHARILEAENALQAASRLGVSYEALNCYLGKFLHQGQPMTIALLKGIPAETLRETYVNYDSPWKPLPIKLENYPFSGIHARILQSENSGQAANRLGVKDVILNRYLGKFLHQSQPMTFELLKRIPAETLRQTYANYDSPWKSPSIKLKNYAFSLIHARILETKNLRQAANHLGVKDEALKHYLNKFTYEALPLTYQILKQTSPENLRQALGSLYDEVSPAKVDLNNASFEWLHAQVLATENWDSLQQILGVKETMFNRHVGNLLYEEKPLTYSRLKKLSPAELKLVWGEQYTWTLKNITLHQNATSAALKRRSDLALSEESSDSVTFFSKRSRTTMSQSETQETNNPEVQSMEIDDEIFELAFGQL